MYLLHAVQAPPAALPLGSVLATAARASPLHPLPPVQRVCHRKQHWQLLRRQQMQAAAVHRVSLGCALLRLLHSYLTTVTWRAASCCVEQVMEQREHDRT